MKSIFFGVVGYFLACVAGDAISARAETEVALFAALTISTDQSARVLISNVTLSREELDSSPCRIHVRFFGPDGAQSDEVSGLQLKPGESRSITASHPTNLLRASVGFDDMSNTCELKARVEVFDLHTGTTFVSVAADQSIGPLQCAPALTAVSANEAQDITSGLKRRRVSRRHRRR